MVVCLDPAPLLPPRASPDLPPVRPVSRDFPRRPTPRRLDWDYQSARAAIRGALDLVPWNPWNYRIVAALAALLLASGARLVADGELLAGSCFALFAVGAITRGFRYAARAGLIAGCLAGARVDSLLRVPLEGRRYMLTSGACSALAIIVGVLAFFLELWLGIALYVFCDFGAALYFASAEEEAYNAA